MAVWYKGLPQGGGMAGRQDVNYLMLYDAGDECTDVTGGWTYTTTKNSNTSYINKGQYETVNSIDYRVYSQMCCMCRDLFVEGTDNHYYAPSAMGIGDEVKSHSDKTRDSYTGIITLNLTGQNGKAFVRVTSNALSTTIVTGTKTSSYLKIYHKYDSYATVEYCLYDAWLVKPDHWQTWLIKAGLTVSDYASLDTVIADNTALTTLMSDKEAVDYMLYHCTGTVMAAVIRSQAALEAIAGSPYNERIFKNQHWNKFLRMAGAVPESEKMYLYRYGDECMDVTGGWITNGYTFDTSTSMTSPPTKNSKDITFARTTSSSGMTTIGTHNAIDLSGYTAIKVYGTNSRVGISTTGLYITTSKVIVTGLLAQQTSNKGEADGVILRIDISKLTNVGYIAFNSGYVGALTFVIKKAWLER